MLSFHWASGCALPPSPVCITEGKDYGTTGQVFTAQWHEFYKRALSFMDGGCYTHARADFDEAIKIKYSDKKWANTYGMHFIDYFPHREKGITLYLMNNYEAAENELEISIKHEPSAKSFYYLDKVRKRLLQGKKPILSLPSLELKYKNRIIKKPFIIRTNEDPLFFSGIAGDEQYVSKVTVMGKEIFMEGSGKEIEFENRLNLDQGEHKIEIKAYNLAGLIKKKNLTIYIDRSGPVIAVKIFKPGIKLEGYLYDQSGIKKFSATGIDPDIFIREDGFFSIPLINFPLSRLNLSAEDKLGNVTKTEICEKKVRGSSSCPLGFWNRSCFSFKDDMIADTETYGSYDQGDGVKIIFKGWPAHKKVFSKNVKIEGEINARSDIAEVILQVNGEKNREIILYKGETKKVKSRFVAFCQVIFLDKGANRVKVSVKVKSGKISDATIQITRKIPEVFKIKHRYRLKVCLTDNGDWKKETSFLKRGNLPFFTSYTRSLDINHLLRFYNFFSQSLKEQNRFQIKENDKLMAYYREYKIGWIDKDQADQKNMSPPHALLLCDTYEDKNGIEISARLVDIKTSEIISVKHVKSLDAYTESKDYDSLKKMAQRLSDKLLREFPLLNGNLILKNKKTVIADFAQSGKHGEIEGCVSAGKIRLGWPLLIYRRTGLLANPVTDISYGSQTRVMGHTNVDGLINKNGKCMCGSIKPLKQNVSPWVIKPGDMVITR